MMLPAQYVPLRSLMLPAQYVPLRSHNDVTCTICSFLFQALDDILLENEGNVSK